MAVAPGVVGVQHGATYAARMRFPGAMQHAVLLRKTGIVPDAGACHRTREPRSKSESPRIRYRRGARDAAGCGCLADLLHVQHGGSARLAPGCKTNRWPAAPIAASLAAIDCRFAR